MPPKGAVKPHKQRAQAVKQGPGGSGLCKTHKEALKLICLHGNCQLNYRVLCMKCKKERHSQHSNRVMELGEFLKMIQANSMDFIENSLGFELVGIRNKLVYISNFRAFITEKESMLVQTTQRIATCIQDICAQRDSASSILNLLTAQDQGPDPDSTAEALTQLKPLISYNPIQHTIRITPPKVGVLRVELEKQCSETAGIINSIREYLIKIIEVLISQEIEEEDFEYTQTEDLDDEKVFNINITKKVSEVEKNQQEPKFKLNYLKEIFQSVLSKEFNLEEGLESDVNRLEEEIKVKTEIVQNIRKRSISAHKNTHDRHVSEQELLLPEDSSLEPHYQTVPASLQSPRPRHQEPESSKETQKGTVLKSSASNTPQNGQQTLSPKNANKIQKTRVGENPKSINSPNFKTPKTNKIRSVTEYQSNITPKPIKSPHANKKSPDFSPKNIAQNATKSTVSELKVDSLICQEKPDFRKTPQSKFSGKIESEPCDLPKVESRQQSYSRAIEVESVELKQRIVELESDLKSIKEQNDCIELNKQRSQSSRKVEELQKKLRDFQVSSKKQKRSLEEKLAQSTLNYDKLNNSHLKEIKSLKETQNKESLSKETQFKKKLQQKVNQLQKENQKRIAQIHRQFKSKENAYQKQISFLNQKLQNQPKQSLLVIKEREKNQKVSLQFEEVKKKLHIKEQELAESDLSLNNIEKIFQEKKKYFEQQLSQKSEEIEIIQGLLDSANQALQSKEDICERLSESILKNNDAHALQLSRLKQSMEQRQTQFMQTKAKQLQDLRQQLSKTLKSELERKDREFEIQRQQIQSNFEIERSQSEIQVELLKQEFEESLSKIMAENKCLSEKIEALKTQNGTLNAMVSQMKGFLQVQEGKVSQFYSLQEKFEQLKRIEDLRLSSNKILEPQFQVQIAPTRQQSPNSYKSSLEQIEVPSELNSSMRSASQKTISSTGPEPEQLARKAQKLQAAVNKLRQKESEHESFKSEMLQNYSHLKKRYEEQKKINQDNKIIDIKSHYVQLIKYKELKEWYDIAMKKIQALNEQLKRKDAEKIELNDKLQKVIKTNPPSVNKISTHADSILIPTSPNSSFSQNLHSQHPQFITQRGRFDSIRNSQQEFSTNSQSSLMVRYSEIRSIIDVITDDMQHLEEKVKENNIIEKVYLKELDRKRTENRKLRKELDEYREREREGYSTIEGVKTDRYFAEKSSASIFNHENYRIYYAKAPGQRGLGIGSDEGSRVKGGTMSNLEEQPHSPSNQSFYMSEKGNMKG